MRRRDRSTSFFLTTTLQSTSLSLAEKRAGNERATHFYGELRSVSIFLREAGERGRSSLRGMCGKLRSFAVLPYELRLPVELCEVGWHVVVKHSPYEASCRAADVLVSAVFPFQATMAGLEGEIVGFD